MKKLVSIFLACLMILALGVPAFAEQSTKLTIEAEGARQYYGYKLLNLTTSLKTGNQHPQTCDGDHDDNCYNFAYTVNSQYRTVLRQEVFDNGGNYLWDANGKPATASAVTDDQILKYLANQTGDEGNVYHTMRQVADRLYRAIKADPNIDPERDDLTGAGDDIDQGYWMFADVTTGLTDAANSLVLVDTKSQEKLEITVKTSLPTVEKKVKDIEDSEDDRILDNAWHDSADHDMSDVVPFKITATLPTNVLNYESFKLVFHDSMSSAFSLVTDEGVDNPEKTIKVYMYETKHKADADTDLNDVDLGAAKDVTASFVFANENLPAGETFTLTCNNVLALEGITKDVAFVVYYEAVFGGNGVAMGAAGNENKAYVEYTNNPYGGDTLGKTDEDVVKVFTYQLVINKTDGQGVPLEGAGFKLSKKKLTGEYVLIGTEKTGGTSFTWSGLDDGDYKLEESTIPEGYNGMGEMLFTISATHSEVSGSPELTVLDGGLMGVGEVGGNGALTGSIIKEIQNKTGAVLPQTGAMGTMWLIFGGATLIVLAGVFMITRKKMSVYED